MRLNSTVAHTFVKIAETTACTNQDAYWPNSHLQVTNLRYVQMAHINCKNITFNIYNTERKNQKKQNTCTKYEVVSVDILKCVPNISNQNMAP
jgi:hypothetical protein